MGIIRILLALSIVLGHARGSIFGIKLVNDGQMAVQAFFIISGFYSTHALLSKKSIKNRRQFSQYIRKKYSKLIHPYLLVTFISLVINISLYLLVGENTFVNSFQELIGARAIIPLFVSILANISVIFQQFIHSALETPCL